MAKKHILFSFELFNALCKFHSIGVSHSLQTVWAKFAQSIFFNIKGLRTLNIALKLPEYPIIMEMHDVSLSLAPQFIIEIGDDTRLLPQGAFAAFTTIALV